MTDALQTKIAELEAREQRRDERDARLAIERALAGKVVDGAAPTVIAALRGRGAIVARDGETRIKLGGEELDVAAGVDRFLKSSEGAYFRPAPQAPKTPARFVDEALGIGETPPAPKAQETTVEARFRARYGQGLLDAI